MMFSLFLGASLAAASRQGVKLQAKTMTASEALELGFISVFDNDNATDSFAEVRQHMPELVQGRHAKCPEVQIYATTDGACDPKNLVVITCISANNIPSYWAWSDTVNPLVKFWVNSEDNKANTVGYHNNENPNYHFGCPFIYEGALNFDGKVMQVDALIELTIGEFAAGGSINIDTAFLSEHDRNGDGVFELVVNLFKNGAQISKNSQASTVHFKFQLIKAEGYRWCASKLG
ncbi:unnamed protein product [Effrenium voratum]|uniref:Uncharacterized protein n=1 Tax=Effrenium voratum TaxID=2562239 RepID=A0AA36N0N2_9DINO|nr:unnamed protein product [Effrenium voratum]